jgi:hypothetical protein
MHVVTSVRFGIQCTLGVKDQPVKVVSLSHPRAFGPGLVPGVLE